MQPSGPDHNRAFPGDGGSKPDVSRGLPVPGPALDEGQRGVYYPLSKRDLVDHFKKYVEPRLTSLLRQRAYDKQVQDQFNAFVAQYYQRIDPRFQVICDTRLVYGVLYVEPHDLSRPVAEDSAKAAAAQEGGADRPVTGTPQLPDLECDR